MPSCVLKVRPKNSAEISNVAFGTVSAILPQSFGCRYRSHNPEGRQLLIPRQERMGCQLGRQEPFFDPKNFGLWTTFHSLLTEESVWASLVTMEREKRRSSG